MLNAHEVLQNTFGYSEFRGQQQTIIETLIRGDDALVIMPTGGGKSLCYQIPSIVRSGCGVVISPLIALMEDQVNALNELGIRAGFLNSTQSYDENLHVENALLSGELELLYIAPERLRQSRMVHLLQQSTIALFAIDEAHCVSQWGHDFRADYLQLHQLAELFPSVPRVALTATADARTQQEILQRLCITHAQEFVAGFDRPNIFYQIELKQQPKQQLLHFIKTQHKDDAGIVYCLSRKKTEDVATWLSKEGFMALPYHAGLSHEKRSLHQQRFLREEKIIIVATIAFGMGIDKPDVRFVAHLDLPKSIEAYYQETGRSGRDGEPANAWMVYGLEDVIKLREMMGSSSDHESAEKNEYKRVEHQKLEAMLGLCEITTCRRCALLGYFGDAAESSCGNCDMCKNPATTWDGTEAAQKAISCAYRTEQRFGVGHLIDVLVGAKTEKIRQFGHQSLSVYGIGKALSKLQWRSVYRQLIARNFLTIDYQNFNRVLLAESCRALLKGDINIELRQDSTKKTPLTKSTGLSNQYGAQQQHSELWELLRICRMQLAKEKSVPPYVIFHDSVLMQMVEALPLTQAHFAQLSGVGEKKCKQYADVFIEVINEYMENKRNSGELSKTIMETLQCIGEGQRVEEVAATRTLSMSTVYSHAAQLIRHRELTLEQVIELPDSEVVRVESCFIDHQTMEETAKLKPVYEALAEEYDYGVLRCLHANFLTKL
jgi:ATP-dependent DNA helicase RecQ